MNTNASAATDLSAIQLAPDLAFTLTSPRPRYWIRTILASTRINTRFSAQINVVVMRGVNDDEVADFAALTASQPINVRFIEYMPFDGNVWSDSKMVPYRELLDRIRAAFPDTPLERLDDPAGEVAKNFRLK
ncbi:Molybdopterin biosynthesis protein CNX2, partial [Tetrabaena socialis]